MSTEMINRVLRVGEGRSMKRMQGRVAKIADLEPDVQKLSDAELRAKTDELRARVEEGADLDDLVDETFAIAREAGVRTLGLRMFDVQLVGAMTLHEGRVAEMKTGEGKTLA